MLKADVLKHFGNASRVARFLGIKPQAVAQWGELVPETRAYEIQVKTAGALRVDESRYRRAAAPSTPAQDTAA